MWLAQANADKLAVKLGLKARCRDFMTKSSFLSPNGKWSTGLKEREGWGLNSSQQRLKENPVLTGSVRKERA